VEGADPKPETVVYLEPAPASVVSVVYYVVAYPAPSYSVYSVDYAE